MKKRNWLGLGGLVGLTLSITSKAAIVSVSPEALQGYINGGKIKACESFCVQTVEDLDGNEALQSISVIATNNLTVSAEIDVSVTVTNITPGSATNITATIPALSSYSVYQGTVINSASNADHLTSYNLYPGNVGTVHNDSFVYELPWERSTKHEALNSNEDYFEFAMPEHTPVLAARAGTVVGIKDKEDIRDNSTTNNYTANEIYLQHDDQTIGVYQNIAQNGALVELGSEIAQSQQIALSGQTGNAVIAKLTFFVTRPPAASETGNVNINFITEEGTRSYFTQYERYTAVHESTTIDPDLSFENDPGLDSGGSLNEEENGNSTDTDSGSGGNTDNSNNNDTGNNDSDTDSGSTDNGNTDQTPDTDTTPDTGSTPDTSTPDSSDDVDSTPAKKKSGGGPSSPLLLLVISMLAFLRRK